MKSALDPWVVDFVAPKLFSKTRDRAFRQADTTTGDNLEEPEDQHYYFRLHKSLESGGDINLSEWLERNSKFGGQRRQQEEEPIEYVPEVEDEVPEEEEQPYEDI